MRIAEKLLVHGEFGADAWKSDDVDVVYGEFDDETEFVTYKANEPYLEAIR